MALAPAVRPEAHPSSPGARTGYYAVLSSLKICEFHDFITNFRLFRLHWCMMHAWRVWLIPVFQRTPECVTREPCKAPKRV